MARIPAVPWPTSYDDPEWISLAAAGGCRCYDPSRQARSTAKSATGEESASAMDRAADLAFNSSVLSLSPFMATPVGCVLGPVWLAVVRVLGPVWLAVVLVAQNFDQ